ncbi:hypothetical protein ACVWZA_001956 [Sphingomonas sp. UYAg733]
MAALCHYGARMHLRAPFRLLPGSVASRLERVTNVERLGCGPVFEDRDLDPARQRHRAGAQSVSEPRPMTAPATCAPPISSKPGSVACKCPDENSFYFQPASKAAISTEQGLMLTLSGEF